MSALVASGACRDGAASGRDDDPLGRSQALTADAGAREPGVYLVGKYAGSADAGELTEIGAGVALDPAELASFEPGATGLVVDGIQLPVPFGNSVFVTDAVAPEIVRYDADDTGALTETGRVNFASVGLEFVTGYDLTIASSTKAYLFDSANFRAIAWDPSTLQITGELDYSAAVRDGLSFALGARDARISSGLLYVPAYWFSEEDFSTEPTSAVLVIDPATDELNLAEDSRCATYSLVALPSGELYAFPDGFFAQETYLDVPAPRAPTCSLRISAGARTYDPDIAIDLGALVGGDEFIGGGVQGGIGDGKGSIYLAVADEQLYFAGEANVFRLWRWNIAENEATELADAPLWNAYLSSFTTGGQVFAVLPGDEATTILEVSQPTLVPFELPGYVEVFSRLPGN